MPHTFDHLADPVLHLRLLKISIPHFNPNDLVKAFSPLLFALVGVCPMTQLPS